MLVQNLKNIGLVTAQSLMKNRDSCIPPKKKNYSIATLPIIAAIDAQSIVKLNATNRDLKKALHYTSHIHEVSQSFNVLAKERFVGKQSDLTIIVHGIGKPLEFGDGSFYQKQTSPLSWESFFDGAFPKENEDLWKFRWNSGTDIVGDSPLAALKYYLLNRENCLSLARKTIIQAYADYKENGQKINLVCHSLGAVLMFSVLKEAQTQGILLENGNLLKLGTPQKGDPPNTEYFYIDKFIMLGSFVKAFYLDSEVNFNDAQIRKIYNIYNPQDEAGIAYLIIAHSTNFGDINSIGTGEIKSPCVQNIETNVRHGDMMFDVGIIRQIKNIYIKD